MNKELPKIDGRFVLLKVGKKYDSRTLRFALDKVFQDKPLNAEERAILISLKCQVMLHLTREEE